MITSDFSQILNRFANAETADGPEDRRLEELYALDVLNVAEERLRTYTEMCADLFGVPVATVGIPEIDTTWFKGNVGWETEACDREVSFCHRAIREPDLLIVEDAANDERFRHNQLVTQNPHIRFYAGAVIHGRNGEPVGSLCLIDYAPRAFSDYERKILRRIRDLVHRELIRYREGRSEHEALVQEALTDKVTGLASPRLMRDRINQALETARANHGTVNVLFADVLRYAELVRVRGYEAGNAVLAAVGQRLGEALPESCAACRWVRDKFVILAPDFDGQQDFDDLVRIVLNAFEDPIQVDGERLYVAVRIGGARAPHDTDDTGTLIELAQQAVDRVTTSRESGFAAHSKAVTEAAKTRLEMENRLRTAIDAGALSLAYQPKLDLRTGRVTGAEALMRWYDADLGRVSPGDFIPLAEEAGLITAMGAWALHQACADAAHWRSTEETKLDVAVNVSIRQLQDPGFPESVRAALDSSGLDPARLQLEVTESALMDDWETVRDNMAAVVAMGVTFAIDDFGTGHSSFAYLRDLPIATLKLDRSFVDPICRSDRDARVCQGMISLGHALGLTVVGEGVEGREQALFLKAYGCDQVQGFHYAKPMSDDDFKNYSAETASG